MFWIFISAWNIVQRLCRLDWEIATREFTYTHTHTYIYIYSTYISTYLYIYIFDIQHVFKWIFDHQAGYHSPLQSRTLAEAWAESAWNSKRLGMTKPWGPIDEAMAILVG